MKSILFTGITCLGLALFAFTEPQKKESDPIAIMTFNIRYDNPDDAPNNWANRKEFVGELIHFYNPDFIGTQEVLIGQLKDMKQLLPEYDHLGVARDDGKEAGEFSPILYKKNKFTPIRSSTFWLSETPEKAGVMGWDAVCNRVVTWGEFKNNATGQTFFVFNTHFDHRGKVARKESAKLLLKKVKEVAKDQDAIITGDFNASPDSEPYQIIVNGTEDCKGLIDSRALAAHPYGPSWTANSFGKTPVEKRSRIDHIFTNKKVEVRKHVAISEQRGDIFPSDHLPVMAEISFHN